MGYGSSRSRGSRMKAVISSSDGIVERMAVRRYQRRCPSDAAAIFTQTLGGTLSRIVFGVFGTWGDLFPVVGMGAELTRRGHDVTIATGDSYRPIVEGSGVGFSRVGRNTVIDALAVNRDALTTRRGGLVGLRRLWEGVLLPQFDESVDDLRVAVRDADLLVGHWLQLASPLAAELEGVRLATACVSHLWIPSELVPPPGRMPLFGAGDPSQSWPRVIAAVDEVFDGPVNEARRRLGLSERKHVFWDAVDRVEAVLVLSSPVVSPPPSDWPPHVRMTGFVGWDGADTWGPDPRLREFLADGPPPVVVSLGSSASLDPGLFEKLAEVIVEAGARAILLTGPRPDELRFGHENLLAVPFAPSSYIFRRARMVVHHGGAGTLMAALAAGRAQLCLPRGFDQAWWAERLAALGAGLVVPWHRADVD